MSLKYAILGSLSVHSHSGYDLWKLFNGSVSYYWPATHTQIYKTLSELASEKLVETEIIHQVTSSDRKVYHISKLGKKELGTWLRTPVELSPIRDKYMVQFTFSDDLKNKEIINNIESYIKLIEEKLNDLKTVNYADNMKYARSEREIFLWTKTLDYGIVIYENRLQWLKTCLSEYKRLFGDKG